MVLLDGLLTGNALIYSRLEGSLTGSCIGCTKCDLSLNALGLFVSNDLDFFKSKVIDAYGSGLIKETSRDSALSIAPNTRADVVQIRVRGDESTILRIFSEVDIIQASAHYCPKECYRLAFMVMDEYYKIFNAENPLFQPNFNVKLGKN